jgi:hypothetical protein
VPIDFGSDLGTGGEEGGGGGTTIDTSTIQTSPQSILDLTRENVPLMVDLVAGLMGRPDDPATRHKALLYLDRAADRLNMRGVLLYKITEVSYTDFTDGQQSLDLPINWGWPADSAAVYDPDDNLIGKLHWVQWDNLRYSVNDPASNAGVPKRIAFRHQGDAKLFVSPPIDPDSIGSLIVPYMQRCERPSDSEDIVITPETREALITGGEAFATRYRYAKYPNIWRPMMEEFDRCVEGAIIASQRWLNAAQLSIYPDFGQGVPPNNINPDGATIPWVRLE